MPPDTRSLGAQYLRAATERIRQNIQMTWNELGRSRTEWSSQSEEVTGRQCSKLRTECHPASGGKPRRWNCRSTPLLDDPEEKEENLVPHRAPQEAPGGRWKTSNKGETTSQRDEGRRERCFNAHPRRRSTGRGRGDPHRVEDLPED